MNDGYDIRPIPRSFLKRVVDIYNDHQEIARTEPGIMRWRVTRQFSTYWDRGNHIFGCFDRNDDLVGFIAWAYNYISDPYRGIQSIEFDDEKKRNVRVQICWHEQLMVVPEHRKRGLGRKMMEFMFSMTNNDVMRNICHEEWLMNFYNSLGFENVYHGTVPKNPDQLYWLNERK